MRWGKAGSGFSSQPEPVPEQRPGKRPGRAELPAKTDGTTRSRAVLAGCNTGMDAEKYARAIDELRGLAEACGLEVVSAVLQNAVRVTHATYMGSGKVRELKEEVENLDADIVLFNEALTPMQTRNLEKELDTEVLDRTGLILQIFASRARTREAKLQVESAQLQYMLPRLVGMRASLSRQGGGSGRLSNKGAGEQKLELDRRRIEHRIAELGRELEVVERERATQRSRRNRNGLTRAALVGYTNAGKSTIMNALLRYCADNPSEAAESKQVFQADMLFATLDTAVRRIGAPGHLPFLLTDTVGFISDLPHALVKAFRSTLDEVCCADLLLEVVDFSDPEYRSQIEITAKTLEEIGAGNIPVVYLYNKADLVLEKEKAEKTRPAPGSIPFRRGEILYLAAAKDIGIQEILTLIDDALAPDRVTRDYLIPYTDAALLQEIRSRGALLLEEYLPEGIRVRARCREADALRWDRRGIMPHPRRTPVV
ncbi:MAG: GTPase HflX [Eubacteriales bacterium]|nr:GTPase HflX [Eubacteriales bacterium]